DRAFDQCNDSIIETESSGIPDGNGFTRPGRLASAIGTDAHEFNAHVRKTILEISEEPSEIGVVAKHRNIERDGAKRELWQYARLDGRGSFDVIDFQAVLGTHLFHDA